MDVIRASMNPSSRLISERAIKEIMNSMTQEFWVRTSAPRLKPIAELASAIPIECWQGEDHE
jgi:hypothetical protein